MEIVLRGLCWLTVGFVLTLFVDCRNVAVYVCFEVLRFAGLVVWFVVCCSTGLDLSLVVGLGLRLVTLDCVLVSIAGLGFVWLDAFVWA